MLLNDITGKREYALTLASYGFGMAVSYVISKSLDYKIIDAKLNWNKATLINKYTEGTNPSTDRSFKILMHLLADRSAQEYCFIHCRRIFHLR